MHEMKYKRMEMEVVSECSDYQPKQRLLGPGDLFGEVSLLYGCRRTATVQSQQYCECAFLNQEEFSNLMSSHNVFKRYLQLNIQRNYDDELRIFLVTCLKEIDYLQGLGPQTDEILSQISMNMIAYSADKDSFLINANDSFAHKDDFDQQHMQECLDNTCPCQ